MLLVLSQFLVFFLENAVMVEHQELKIQLNVAKSSTTSLNLATCWNTADFPDSFMCLSNPFSLAYIYTSHKIADIWEVVFQY